jgi:hypothetical protein
MSFDVPESSLTFEELGKITNFSREVADALDAALADTGGIAAVVTDGTTVLGDGTTENPLHVPVPVTGIPVLNVKESPYNATGDGVTDDSLAIRAAITAAVAAGGAIIYFPKGTYIVSKDPMGAWCVDVIGDNITFMGVKGSSIIKAAPGMPATSIAVVRVNEKSNITFREMTIDGNWGNYLTCVSAASDGLTLPQATIGAEDTSGFAPSGTFTVETTVGLEVVTYTGKTATTFTGCTGGTGKLIGTQANPFGPTGKGRPLAVTDSQTGLNHLTQADPKNYGLMIRGAENIVVENCIFQQIYGDAIWCGQGATNFFTKWTKNVNIARTKINMCARDGIAFGQRCESIRIHQCEITNTYFECVDTEPVGAGTGVRNITVDSCYLAAWWGRINPLRNNNLAISVTSSSSLASGPASAARNYRITNNRIEGGIYITNSTDVVVERNKVTCDWVGNGNSPIVVLGASTDITISGNRIYSRVAGWSAAVTIAYFAAGAVVQAPRNVRVTGNYIYARNGLCGIQVNGQGGQEFAGVLQAGISGVATGVSGFNSTTVTDSGAAWTANQWQAYQVHMGSAYGTILSNTATTFTVDCWTTVEGGAVSIPTAGTYTIMSGGGVLDIVDNHIDCTNDGNGQGTYGIQVAQTRAGGHIRVQRNVITNATPAAIWVDATGRSTPFVDVRHNHARTNEATNTAHHVKFTASVNIVKLVYGDNSQEDGIVAATGLSSGAWLEADGSPTKWAGYGTPEGVVTAPVGSMYRRVDGGVGTTLYVKETGVGNTGWAAK